MSKQVQFEGSIVVKSDKLGSILSSTVQDVIVDGNKFIVTGSGFQITPGTSNTHDSWREFLATVAKKLPPLFYLNAKVLSCEVGFTEDSDNFNTKRIGRVNFSNSILDLINHENPEWKMKIWSL